MKLTIVRGLPGSGKSTYAKKLGCLHLEADMFHYYDGEYQFSLVNHSRSHEICQKMVDTAMSANVMHIVVSNTFTLLHDLQPYFDMAKSNGYDIEIIRMESNYGSIHNVPSDIIDIMKNRFEPLEGELIIYG